MPPDQAQRQDLKLTESLYVGCVFLSETLSILLPSYVENHLIVNITVAESIGLVGLLYVKAEVRRDLMAGGDLPSESYGTCSRVSKKMGDSWEVQVAGQFCKGWVKFPSDVWESCIFLLPLRILWRCLERTGCLHNCSGWRAVLSRGYREIIQSSCLRVQDKAHAF